MAKNNADICSVVIPVRVTPATATLLDQMTAEGGHASRAACARKILTDVLEDDAQAHGEPGLRKKN